jgi:signal transduction histidine kinase
MLRTVFLNLMDNACKYSTHPSVIIRFIFPAKSVVIECCDQGIGVLPQELEKIFQPFIRGSNILPEVKGYGIGLSLCERIIHLHGGTVTVESVPQKGSTFRVNLPLDNSLSIF